ncbi:MAG: GntR family transcriptional regulator, partial [Herbaspirillum sp.]
ITLRAALNQLEESGIVRRARGSGTFVAKDLSEERWFKLANNLDELVETVSALKTHILSIEHSDHSLIPAFPFGKVGPAYQRLRRVHYYNDIAYCLIDVYLDKELFDSDADGFSNAPIVSKLALRSDVQVADARQIMRITVSDEDTAEHLGIGVGDPIADVCRAFMDNKKQIYYYAHIQYPAQMIQLETDLMQGVSHSTKKERISKTKTKK